MKRFVVVLSLLAAFPVYTHAQSATEEIARAVMAAPPALAADAAVVRLSDDGSREMLRDGTNGLVCYDRSNEPGRDFSAQCTSMGNLARAGQNHQVWMASANAEEARAMFASQENDGSREAPVFGSVWYTLAGSDQASASTNTSHITIAVPFSTSDTIGFPSEGSYGESGSWIMEAGTSNAHLMIPGR